jgi:UDP-4-amino-4-deoxy-L-arabinose-oxoglutarate aminotransferase
VLASGVIARGELEARFEQEVAVALGTLPGVACASGAAALLLALRTLGVSTGDEVLIPTYVCGSVRDAVRATGAIPVLCDVGPTGTLTVETVARHRSPRSRAIIAVHIFGQACDVEGLAGLELPVVEDACQAFGLRISGRSAGALGTLGILSFHATKCLTTGEGGMLVTHDAALAARARDLRASLAAGSGGLSDLQASLGLAQLERYDAFLARRAAIARRYDHSLGRPACKEPAPFRFRYTLAPSGGLETWGPAFAARGIQARRGVDTLLHRLEHQEDITFSGATSLFDSVVSIPFYPGLTVDEVDRICHALSELRDDLTA